MRIGKGTKFHGKRKLHHPCEPHLAVSGIDEKGILRLSPRDDCLDRLLGRGSNSGIGPASGIRASRWPLPCPRPRRESTWLEEA